jgi:hypothetical protein
MTAALVARRIGLTAALVAVSALIGAELIRQPSLTRLLAAACIGLCGVVLAMQWPRTAVLTTLALLPFLAVLRRLLLEFTPWKSTDPLLLLAPAVVVLVLGRLYVLEGRELARGRIGKLVLFLVLLSFLQALNPRGGGVSAGAAALLFTAVPLCWFFVGRELGTPRLLQALYAWIVVSATAIGVYGLIQTWSGLPSWDQMWVKQTGYAALNVGNVIRAFGTFSSAAEYASFLGIGIVVSVAFALAGRPYLLPALPLLAVAVFYESSRSILVTTVFATLAIVAARTGSLRRAALTLALCLGAVALAFVYWRGALQQTALTSRDPLVSHQLSGLANPFNQNTSTLPSHLGLLENGFKKGVLDPFGQGIASTTLAGNQLGSGSTSTEIDVSNVFVGYGTFGGFAYVAVVLLALRYALQQAVERRDAVSLAALGMLIAVFGQWLNGGYYAVSPLIWFTIGFLVAAQLDRSKGPPAEPGEETRAIEPAVSPTAPDA